MRLLIAVLRVGAILTCVACATSPYDRYVRRDPAWVPVLPSVGLGLEEVEASLGVRATSGHDRIVVAFRTLRWSGTAWEEIPTPSAYGGRSTFAVLAKVWCRSIPQAGDPLLKSPVPNRETNVVERVSWYFLPENRLTNWDHYEFVGRCLVANEYQPMRSTAEERALVDAAALLGTNLDFRAHVYQKALRLLEAGRGAEALALYERAERMQEPFQTHHPKWIDEHGETEYPDAVRRFRDRLRSKLAAEGLF